MLEVDHGKAAQPGGLSTDRRWTMSALSLPDMAIQINAEHEQAEKHARDAVTHALKAGEMLLKAKAQCSHGQWLSEAATVEDVAQIRDLANLAANTLTEHRLRAERALGRLLREVTP